MVDERQTYEQKMEAELKLMQSDIDLLREKASVRDGELSETEGRLADLEAKRKAARDKLDQLKQADGEDWRAVKDEVKDVWLDLGSAVRSARRRFD